MRSRFLFLSGLAAAGWLGTAMAQQSGPTEKVPQASASISSLDEKSAATQDAVAASRRDAAMRERLERLEGEKRFRSNCGRCHMPPHKFPPRVMATAIRHMRVRALVTDEDMRLILRYMTE